MAIARWLAVCAFATLAACAVPTINTKLPTYTGQPAGALIAKLGPPTQEQMVAGRKSYTWNTGLRILDGTSYSCRIRVVVDDQDNIIASNWDGNENGCSEYALKLGK